MEPQPEGLHLTFSLLQWVWPFKGNICCSTFTWFLFVLCVFLTDFEFVEEILRCHHSNETTFAVLSHGAVCFSAFLKREILTFVNFWLWLVLGVKVSSKKINWFCVNCVLQCNWQETDGEMPHVDPGKSGARSSVVARTNRSTGSWKLNLLVRKNTAMNWKAVKMVRLTILRS